MSLKGFMYIYYIIVWNHISDLPLDGGCLCFDFINTKGSWKVEVSKEFLKDYFSIINWLKIQNSLSTKYINAITELAKADEVKALEIYEESLKLRKRLYSIFSAIASKSIPNQDCLNHFNLYLNDYYKQLKLDFTGNSYAIRHNLKAENLKEPFYIIIQSAIDIINEIDQKKIKECAECGWLFLDKTKNNRQKWCNPKICGARVKMRNYYKRQKLKQT